MLYIKLLTKPTEFVCSFNFGPWRHFYSKFLLTVIFFLSVFQLLNLFLTHVTHYERMSLLLLPQPITCFFFRLCNRMHHIYEKRGRRKSVVFLFALWNITDNILQKCTYHSEVESHGFAFWWSVCTISWCRQAFNCMLKRNTLFGKGWSPWQINRLQPKKTKSLPNLFQELGHLTKMLASRATETLYCWL